MLPIPADYRVTPDGTSKEIRYQALVVKSNDDFRNKDCIVFLSGTSTQLVDVEFFMGHLLERNHCVASIERFIGGPFDMGIKPDIERKEALKHFIRQLKVNHQIEQFDIIAHSYASFEVVRLLADNPESYREYLRNIIFINPAGFNDHIRFIPHCLRFTFIFILKEYLRVLGYFLKKSREKNAGDRDFYARKLRATNSLFLKTIQNPVKTFKEVADIASFKLKPIVKELIEKYGYTFYFVLNTEDELVAVSQTLKFARHLLPENRIISFPGNHMDLLVNKGQIINFLNILDEIMESS